MTWQASTRRPDAGPAAAAGDVIRRPGHWLSPPGLVVLAATAVALAIRLYLLTRVRYLTGITEYDDGVYLGGAISLISGTLPYHGFAFVQPPGILLLMAPVALLAKVSAAGNAMAVARLLTAAASAACVALLGSLVRHRGALVTLVACGTLAVYPDDIMAAHTLLLEPWMNLLVLAGARVAFHEGRLAAPRRLLWAGVLFGLAGAVKYWAALPALALLATCLLAGPAPRRTDRAVRFAGGAAAGFAVPVLPLAAPWPGLFIRSTLLDQVARAGSAVPEPLRLAHLTGLVDLLNDAGQLTVPASAGSLFARGDVTAAATWATGWLPALLAVALAALTGGCYAAGAARARRGHLVAGVSAGPGPLEWYALGTLACTVAAVLGYSAFFYHYPDLVAPWLAIAAGYAASVLAPRRPGARTRRKRRFRPRPLPLVAAALIVVAGFEAWELSGLYAADVRQDAALIPPGACVVSDEISLTIAANRFTAGSAGCPDVLDSLATTLVAGNGVSVQGGAKALPRVVAAWKAIFARADYVWLSGSNARRIPWTPGLRAWFGRAFRPLRPPPGQVGEGQVYVRTRLLLAAAALDEFEAEAALDAQVTVGDLAVERRGDLDDRVVLDVQVHVAADAAVGADRRRHGLRRLVPGPGLAHGVLAGGHERARRAHADAVAAVHAGGVGEGHVVLGRDARVEAAAGDGDRERVLRVLATGLHALVAEDAARVVADVGLVVHLRRLAHGRGELNGGRVMLARPRRVPLPRRLIRRGSAVPGGVDAVGGHPALHVGRGEGHVDGRGEELEHHPARRANPLGVGVHLHARLGPARAGRHQGARALHLDDAHPAHVHGGEVLQVAERRGVRALGPARVEQGGALGYPHLLTVDFNVDQALRCLKEY